MNSESQFFKMESNTLQIKSDTLISLNVNSKNDVDVISKNIENLNKYINLKDNKLNFNEK